MRPLDGKGHVILVSFSLGRVNALSDAELEVARWASASATNADIARARQTSTNTVARQMSSVLSKLGIGARLGLATFPELSAWAPPDHSEPCDGAALDSLLRTTGPELGPDRVVAIWREVASGRWKTLAGVDAGRMRHATMRRDPGAAGRLARARPDPLGRAGSVSGWPSAEGRRHEARLGSLHRIVGARRSAPATWLCISGAPLAGVLRGGTPG